MTNLQITAQDAANEVLENLDLLFATTNLNGVIKAHTVTGFLALRLHYILEELGEGWEDDAEALNETYSFIANDIYEQPLDVMEADWNVIGPVQNYLKQDISAHRKAFFLTQMLHLVIEATTEEAVQKAETRNEDRWIQMAGLCQSIEQGTASRLAPIFEVFNQAA